MSRKRFSIMDLLVAIFAIAIASSLVTMNLRIAKLERNQAVFAKALLILRDACADDTNDAANLKRDF